MYRNTSVFPFVLLICLRLILDLQLVRKITMFIKQIELGNIVIRSLNVHRCIYHAYVLVNYTRYT